MSVVPKWNIVSIKWPEVHSYSCHTHCFEETKLQSGFSLILNLRHMCTRICSIPPSVYLEWAEYSETQSPLDTTDYFLLSSFALLYLIKELPFPFYFLDLNARASSVLQESFPSFVSIFCRELLTTSWSVSLDRFSH